MKTSPKSMMMDSLKSEIDLNKHVIIKNIKSIFIYHDADKYFVNLIKLAFDLL